MIWEVEIRPLGRDSERERVCDEFDLLTHSARGGDVIAASARGYLLEGELTDDAAKAFVQALLVDPLVESVITRRLDGKPVPESPQTLTVLLKPGVMDPVSESVRRSARDLGLPPIEVRTFRRYFGKAENVSTDRNLMCRRVLANDAIERIVTGNLRPDHLALGSRYEFQKKTVPLRGLSEDQLRDVSRQGMLALNLEEMRAIERHFTELGRDPSDIELETIAQTWSEHCSHKTLKGGVAFTEIVGGVRHERNYKNLLKETIFGATQEIRKRLGAEDWCVSVFVDNAGIVKFDDQNHVCFKVETHNRPSAVEPYGGANTGLGGVIRDVLGTGLGAKPICNTDIFCFAPPDVPFDSLPPGVLHPRRTYEGVVAGVRDYGNRMGIPTVNGAILFDERYLANPLVFCGTVGLLPVGMESKKVNDGDAIVVLGGRTGRDGIHGATFSSEGLTHESETVGGGAVQIGNAIEEKKVLDVLLKARDLGLYSAVTDCGAGGFSSAVGEMAAELGARVQLETAPLKYSGLGYVEIWISESQERMVLAVPPANWEALQKLAASEGVEAAKIGRFEATGRLILSYEGVEVADLSMHFLHEGRPGSSRVAEWPRREPEPVSGGIEIPLSEVLLKILGSWSVCSKERVIRQYDHEVQGGSVVKPLVGVANDGPSDAAVLVPILGSRRGLAVGNGINPLYADLDPYAAAACAIDEAVRNVVAVGADPSRIAILDNFCWGNIAHPETLGALVLTAEACRDVALAYGTPFISGKDSLNNEFVAPDRRITIPYTLLVSALGQVPDVLNCTTMDFKEPGNEIWILGATLDELGGSHLHKITGRKGGKAPKPDLRTAPELFHSLHQTITAGLVRSCHDLSEGGLAVSLAESCFAGGVGADIDGLQALPGAADLSDETKLFSESPTRFLIEVRPENAGRLRETLAGVSHARIGKTTREERLRIAGSSGEWLLWMRLSELKEAWQKPLAE